MKSTVEIFESILSKNDKAAAKIRADFIDKYVELLKSDDTIKYEHKITWNNIISN